tara:strand:+ start:852 stop:1331 length:480 start_codon:yes stop_codon:yes gene_type:complete
VFCHQFWVWAVFSPTQPQGISLFSNQRDNITAMFLGEIDQIQRPHMPILPPESIYIKSDIAVRRARLEIDTDQSNDAYVLIALSSQNSRLSFKARCEMKTDSNVSLPLLGILLVAVIGLVLYLVGFVLAHFGIPIASAWIYVALALVPVVFVVLFDFSR